MSEGVKRSSPYVKSADLLPPPPLGRALLFAGIATALGTAAWGLLAFYAHRELGILAWGIGGLIGFAIVRAGGHGTFLAVCGGALALLSIGSGKQMAFRMSVDQEITMLVADMNESAHAERTKDAADWVALGPSPTPDQVKAFTDGHGYEVDDLKAFASEEGPRLRAFAEARPTVEQWREEQKAEIARHVSFVEFLKDDFHPLDIVFVLFGVATAFGMVSKATAAMQAAARQALREQREAAESKPAT